jgi:phospholipid/cholesterol/gamma-HCH transport system substrate-binding protein
VNTRYQFSRAKEWMGGFVLVALALAVIGIILAARAQRWFAEYETVRVILPQEGAFGLREGAEVFVLGIAAGWVNEITVEKEEQVIALVKIRRSFQRFIRTDSVANLEKTFGLAGDTILEITRGNGPPLLEKGGALVAVAPEDLMERLQTMLADVSTEVTPLVKNAQAALEEWKALGSSLRERQEQLHQMLTTWEKMTADIQEGQGTVGRLLTDPEFAEKTSRLLEQGRHSLTNLQATLDHIQEGTRQLPEIGEQLAAGAESLPGLLLQAQQTMREIEVLVDGLQQHWLVRGYMDRSEPRPRIPPSRVQGGAP